MEEEDHRLNRFSYSINSLFKQQIVLVLNFFNFIYYQSIIFHYQTSYHLKFQLFFFISNYLKYSYLQFIQLFYLHQLLIEQINQGRLLPIQEVKIMFFLLALEVAVLHLNQIVIMMMIEIYQFLFCFINFLLIITHLFTILQFCHYYFRILLINQVHQLQVLANQMEIII